MATCIFSEVEHNMNSFMGTNKWVVERPFLPQHIGDGQFLMQIRPKGEPMAEMWTTRVDTFAEQVVVGNC